MACSTPMTRRARLRDAPARTDQLGRPPASAASAFVVLIEKGGGGLDLGPGMVADGGVELNSDESVDGGFGEGGDGGRKASLGRGR